MSLNVNVGTAKKSIATFKVRKEQEIGAMVTLRGNVMYEFLDRLVNVAMPRIKDFRGANPNAFDGHGNYSLGVTEQIIFDDGTSFSIECEAADCSLGSACCCDLQEPVNCTVHGAGPVSCSRPADRQMDGKGFSGAG